MEAEDNTNRCTSRVEHKMRIPAVSVHARLEKIQVVLGDAVTFNGGSVGGTVCSLYCLSAKTCCYMLHRYAKSYSL